jgi:hypothetical protein
MSDGTKVQMYGYSVHGYYINQIEPAHIHGTGYSETVFHIRKCVMVFHIANKDGKVCIMRTLLVESEHTHNQSETMYLVCIKRQLKLEHHHKRSRAFFLSS